MLISNLIYTILQCSHIVSKLLSVIDSDQEMKHHNVVTTHLLRFRFVWSSS